MDEESSCGVCNNSDPKYKCPHCELRYCSIACFKTHIASHDALPEPANTAELLKGLSLPQSPTRSHTPPADPVRRLREDDRFVYLFKKYPDLRTSLRRVYQATVHPLTLLESGVELEGGEDEESLARKWGGPEMRRWSANEADERALKMLLGVQRRDDGVAEFLELARAVLAADRDEDGANAKAEPSIGDMPGVQQEPPG